jgi:hypothetical protein
VAQVERGQVSVAAPGAVDLPFEVVRPAAGALRAPSRLDEPGVLVAGVVEDGVEHEADAAGAQGEDQRIEGAFPAEARVDAPVVADVVAVVRGRGEDGRQEDGAGPQGLHVVEVLDDAPEVAAAWRVSYSASQGRGPGLSR